MKQTLAASTDSRMLINVDNDRVSTIIRGTGLEAAARNEDNLTPIRSAWSTGQEQKDMKQALTVSTDSRIVLLINVDNDRVSTIIRGTDLEAAARNEDNLTPIRSAW